jgi:hypothetical protein
VSTCCAATSSAAGEAPPKKLCGGSLVVAEMIAEASLFDRVSARDDVQQQPPPVW